MASSPRIMPTVDLQPKQDNLAEQSSRPRRHKTTTDYAQSFDDEDGHPPYDRPKRITNTARVKKVQQAAFTKNATKSRLLRLPPELRTRIWKLVFGGKIVHVWDDGDYSYEKNCKTYKLVRTICKCDTDGVKEVQLIRDSQAKVLDSFDVSHKSCNLRVNHHKKVTVCAMLLTPLLTCRQIHQEAALLPYQCNTFQFKASSDLKLFMENLVPAQSRALQHISVLYSRCISSYHDYAIKAQLGEQVQTVKTLELFVQFERMFECGLVGGRVAQAFRTYEQLKIGKVSVAAYNIIGDLGGDEDRFDTRVYLKIVGGWR